MDLNCIEMDSLAIIVLISSVLLVIFSGALSVFTDNLKNAGILIGRAITTEIDPNNALDNSLLTVCKKSLRPGHWLMAKIFLQVPNTILVLVCTVSYFFLSKLGSFAFLLIHFMGMYFNKKTTREFRYYLALYTKWLTKARTQYEAEGDPTRANALKVVLGKLSQLFEIYKDSNVPVPYSGKIKAAPLGELDYLKKEAPLFFKDELEKLTAANKAKSRE